MPAADQDMFGDVIGFIHHEKLFDAESPLPSLFLPRQAAAADLHTAALEQTQSHDRTTCPEPALRSGEDGTTAPALQLVSIAPSPSKSEEACSPRCPLITRTHRPSDLTLIRTNGLTTISTPDLRRRICDARTAPGATRFQVQVPRPKADHAPPTPATPSPLFVMGNNASSLVAAAPLNDGASVRSLVPRLPAPVRMLRKSSANLLFNGRRHDSKPPMPSRLTAATVIQVQQQPSVTSLNVTPEESDAELAMETQRSSDELQHIAASHSTSTETILKNTLSQELAPTPTLPESNTTNPVQPKQENRSPRKQSKSESDLRKQATLHRHSALSPSIPAPSPLPEDSPHKYGLKDRLDTPDLPAPEKINVVQGRRRSSGLEIFHEAKSLQSASSFLNGLSTSRRRAESLQRSSESALPSQTTARRSGPKHRSSRPTSALQHTTSSDRCRGHNFKTSGFAYARPLAPAQLKCYRNHMRLIPSSNKRCPVECAVCHIDDEREHFSCSWCALRMCRFCRKEFVENGMVGLRERVRQAELSGRSGDEEEDGYGVGEVGARQVNGRG